MPQEIRKLVLTSSFAAAFMLAGCSSDSDKQGGTPQATPGAAPSAGAATGDTIRIEMITDATGNYYKPREIEAEPGDVLRFVLTMGVHNVHFLPDSNRIKTGLPPASELLQLPGQTYDLVVNFQEGEYYFQCDPHAALGMTGKLEVERED